LGILETLALAVGLAMDACAVSTAARAGGRARGRRAALRLAFHFGLFQALMPVVGWLGGSAVHAFIDRFDHWIAFGLLAGIGANMIRSGLKSEDDAPAAGDPSRRWSLVILSLATSIDALAAGVSLAFLDANILATVAVIGVVTFGLSLVGYYFGSRLGDRFGRRMEIAGGVVLILLGVKILLD
jgi:putative Mn2+ efflux pump MntP